MAGGKAAMGGTQGPMHCPVRESYSILKAGSSQRKLELQATMHCIAPEPTCHSRLKPQTYGNENPETLHSTGTPLECAQPTLTA